MKTDEPPATSLAINGVCRSGAGGSTCSLVIANLPEGFLSYSRVESRVLLSRTAAITKRDTEDARSY